MISQYLDESLPGPRYGETDSSDSFRESREHIFILSVTETVLSSSLLSSWSLRSYLSLQLIVGCSMVFFSLFMI